MNILVYGALPEFKKYTVTLPVYGNAVPASLHLCAHQIFNASLGHNVYH